MRGPRVVGVRPAQLVITVQPAGSVNSGSAVSATLEVRNAAGSVWTVAPVTVVASLASGSGTLTGVTTTSSNNGVALFSNLVLNGSGSHTIRFTISGTGITTTSSAVNVLLVANRLLFQTQPANATDAQAFGTQPVVGVYTAGNELVTTDNNRPVGLTILSGSGSLIGTTTVNTVNGLATFTNVGIDASAPPSSFALRAISSGLTSVDSGSFTVASSTPPSSLFPNEPSSWTLVSDATFESSPLGPFTSGTRDGWGVKFSSDTSRTDAVETITDSVIGETVALTHNYPAFHVGGGGPEFFQDIGGNYRSLYLGMYVKLSANWFGHQGSGINKLAYIQTADANFSVMWVEYAAEGQSQPLRPYLVNQLIGGGGSGIVTNATTGFPERGSWARIEVIIELNVPRIRYWVNGQLFIDSSFGVSTSQRINGVTLSGIMGGIGQSGNPQAQKMQYDRVRIRGN